MPIAQTAALPVDHLGERLYSHRRSVPSGELAQFGDLFGAVASALSAPETINAFLWWSALQPVLLITASRSWR